MKNKFPLVVAVILGIAAVLGIKYYVDSIKEAEAAKYQGQNVVAARKNIAQGTEITEALITQRSVPTQFIPPQAVEGRDEMAEIIGRKTRVNIKAGDLLLWSDLEIQQWGGLSTLIPEGERAFTVDITAGVPSELLQANDRVDILGLFTLPKDGDATSGPQAAWREESDLVCVVLLQGVSILTVGEDMTTYGRPQAAGGGALTFAVTLPEAQLLMFAGEHGTLGVALRGENEVEILERTELGKVTYKEMERVIGDLDNKRKKRVVQIMRGRSLEEVNVEGSAE